MARSPKTRAELINDPSIPYSDEPEDLSTYKDDVSADTYLLNTLLTLRSRADAFLTHFTPAADSSARALRSLADKVDDTAFTKTELREFVDSIEPIIQLAEESANKSQQRTGELINTIETAIEFLKTKIAKEA